MFDKYLQRFIHDNSQVWRNLSFMVFLNFVSILGTYLGYVYKFHDVAFVKTAIGVFSIFVAIVWLVNAEVHRSFQNRHILYLQIIEEILTGKNVNIPYKIYDDKINKFLSGKLKLIWTIRLFVLIYILTWILLIFK